MVLITHMPTALAGLGPIYDTLGIYGLKMVLITHVNSTSWVRSHLWDARHIWTENGT